MDRGALVCSSALPPRADFARLHSHSTHCERIRGVPRRNLLSFGKRASRLKDAEMCGRAGYNPRIRNRWYGKVSSAPGFGENKKEKAKKEPNENEANSAGQKDQGSRSPPRSVALNTEQKKK